MIDGPTPLEISRSPVGWWHRSEQFYLAGEILIESIKTANYKYYTEIAGKPFNKGSGKHTQFKKTILNMQMDTPIVFNLSFSIELLVKAILIYQNPTKWIPEHGNIKFSHKIYKLIENEIPISLTEIETIIAKRLEEYISYGKYPERTRPGDVIEKFEDLFNFHPYNSWDINYFFELITSLRNKLRNFFLELTKTHSVT